MKKILVNIIKKAIHSLSGGGRNGNDARLPESFTPTNLRSLSEIDIAGEPYEGSTVEVEGVISPGGAAGSGGREELGCEVVSFSLAAWRVSGKPIVERDLYVMRPVPIGEIRKYWSDYPKCTVHRMSVLLSKDHTRAVYERGLPISLRDSQLEEIAAGLKRPFFIRTNKFGKLLLNREDDYFEGHARWNGRRIGLNIEAKDKVLLPDLSLAVAEALWIEQVKWTQDLHEFIIKDLLPLRNNTWRRRDESVLTDKAFIKQIKLESVTIDRDGEFKFWLSDGDLFWGHFIEVRGCLKEGFISADLQG